MLPPRTRSRLRTWLVAAGVAAAGSSPAWAQPQTQPLAQALAQAPAPSDPPTFTEPGLRPSAGTLPATVRAALSQARVPATAMAAWVQEVPSGPGPTPAPVLSWQADRPVNPASLMKLLTTWAALERLGPAYTWRTPVWLGGPVRDGVLEGSLVLRGQGDPRLTVERLTALLRRVQALGVREIAGDIVIDRQAFAPWDRRPGDFDGEPLRPYNVAPDAFLPNQRVLVLTFVPDVAQGVARVAIEPRIEGLRGPATVPLLPGECGDWRTGLKADFSDPQRMAFGGGLPAACGERTWPVAHADPAGYDPRLIAALWRDLGGRLRGQVRDGVAPAGQPPTFEWPSVPLAEVIRDINKFSNNPMAEQLFLTLASPPGAGAGGRAGPPDPGLAARDRTPVTAAAARASLSGWAQARLGPDAAGLVVDNGSGLSRDQRITARALARLLAVAWLHPAMPEFIASMPVAGADGTTRRLQALEGRAHLKTGSLRDVAGVAGYVHAANGRRHLVVALIQHPDAQAARPALEALLLSVLDGSVGTDTR